MRFAVITHVAHIQKDKQWLAYAPYVREMNIWFKLVDEVEVVAPKGYREQSKIDLSYRHPDLEFTKIPAIQFTSIKNILVSTFKLPYILFTILKACRKADHIHLRCPGNIGLLGCFAQIFFPNKPKTAKYAGNWDPNSKQPMSYRLQKWILSNTVLTKNMQVLVYGHWPSQSRNIRPFFTATYFNDDKTEIIHKDFTKSLNMVFVGSLVKGKQPLFAVKLVEMLNNKGRDIKLDIYGDGVLKEDMINYVKEHDLVDKVTWHGNVDKHTLKQAYKKGHFVILPSKSEGWPKALAEGMFFGAIPIATKVSCVPWMLDQGRRGILIQNDLNEATKYVDDILKNGNLQAMSVASQQWSQQYTMDSFEESIKSLLN